MRINWLPSKTAQKDNLDALIQEEYRFRSGVTRILLSRMQDYNEVDLENINFDFDTSSKSFKISTSTPEPIYSELKKIMPLLD
ncbi:MAG: hypothetical protein ACFCUL_01260 [Flavobacteriaceae bacterium]